jgi:hypothetical protein
VSPHLAGSLSGVAALVSHQMGFRCLQDDMRGDCVVKERAASFILRQRLMHSPCNLISYSIMHTTFKGFINFCHGIFLTWGTILFEIPLSRFSPLIARVP